jgi:hypothetical protein
MAVAKSASRGLLKQRSITGVTRHLRLLRVMPRKRSRWSVETL